MWYHPRLKLPQQHLLGTVLISTVSTNWTGDAPSPTIARALAAHAIDTIGLVLLSYLLILVL